MELRDILQIRAQDLNSDQKEAIYAVLTDTDIVEIPKKHVKNVLEVALELLRFKGEEVGNMQAQINDFMNTRDDQVNPDLIILQEDNSKLKKIINKLEGDKAALKIRIRNLTEEISSLQKRMQEANSSDREDSSDPLSDLDRKEELLSNINAKNKHIKRLLRDIESLENKNIEQSKAIIDQEEKIQRFEYEFTELKEKYAMSVEDKNALNNSLTKATEEIAHLEENINYLEDERDRTDNEFKQFVDKLEEKAHSWRKIFDDKENQLESLRKKYEELYLKYPSEAMEHGQQTAIKSLVEAMQERDCIIEELEEKLKSMAEDMMASTQLMNRVAHEHESKGIKVTQKDKKCCKQIESALEQANKRCKELAEMLDAIEENSTIKSKQAEDAISALQSYQNGENGLPQSIQKISQLQQKLNSRDKQIKALVMEINSLHEIAQENLILRKKLNIPDDVVISTNNLIAKQRNKDKIIDRLNLKLRASEEMRLQLKLEMNDLRKEISELKKRSNTQGIESVRKDIASKSDAMHKSLDDEEIFCANCLKGLKKLPNKENVIQDIVSEWEGKYSSVIEENENLRVGMHEILEKIREYDASSDHITIDCSILEKVLHALDARSVSGWYHPAMRMQNELIAIKEREHALKEQINIAEKAVINQRTDDNKIDSASVDVIRTTLPKESTIQIDDNNDLIDVNKTESLYQIIVLKDNEMISLRDKFSEISQKYRDNILENQKLRCLGVQFEEMKSKYESSDSEITQYCAVLVDKIADVETKLGILEKKHLFLKEDYERAVNDMKNAQLSSTAIIGDLKKQVINKNQESKIESCVPKPTDMNENADFEVLQRECAILRIQLANLVKKCFAGDIRSYRVDESIAGFINHGIIQDNLELDYITAHEYKKLKTEHSNLLRDSEEMVHQCKHLEKLLEVADEQIKSQQRQLTEFTDNQVNLRHLVADLQSTNEDKFIISKAFRDIEIAKQEITKLKTEKQELETHCKAIEMKLSDSEQNMRALEAKFLENNNNNSIKLRFLKKSLLQLQGKYCKYTPLILLSNFVTSYTSLIQKSEKDKNLINITEEFEKDLNTKLKSISPTSETENLIKIAKYESKSKFLENQVNSLQQRTELLQNELDQMRLFIADENEHWKTINALFTEPNEKTDVENNTVQSVVESKDASTNTEAMDEPTDTTTQNKNDIHEVKVIESDNSYPSSPSLQISKSINIRSLESQLKQAMHLASMRNALLLETENRLAESQGRIKEMEKIIEGQKSLLKQEFEKTSTSDEKVYHRNANLVESTISSLQTLLSEKDTTLSHYQELLKTEREQHTKSCENYEKEIDVLQKNVSDIEAKIKNKNTEVIELNSKLELMEKNIPIHSSSDRDEELQRLEGDDNFNEMSDEKIEEMFMDEHKLLSQEVFNGSINLKEEEEESTNRYIQQLQNQLREASNREMFWEKNARSKDEEIEILKEKLALLQEREKAETKNSPEIEQLRILLDEKDKHINDLMETLTSFHDDQQRFINETSIYSADQVTQLGTDLNRSETTNRILSTQLEALRRQVANLTQREKQARDLVNSLKNQLIKRPVVSVKTELNARTKNEQMQKRLQQLEFELDDARKEIKRQGNLLEAKRTKSATDLALWDKQKRWQQIAEKLKTKLNETETSLEKSKIMLTAAKATISRLEKEKNAAEIRSRGPYQNKCCRTPSCPNLLLTKYIPSETPETYTTGSECNSPAHKHHFGAHNYKHIEVNDSNTDLINVLKARIESQQRRIVALELEGKGSNVLTTELEKNQEKLAALEAQNIRLEAKNLQLQLDIDLMRQGDEKDRQQKRVKYLEDYVLALKEELAEAEAQKEVSNSERRFGHNSLTHPEQTILSLRRIVEKLRVDNKNLKEGRNCFEHRHDSKAGGDLAHELQNVKEKLLQKTQLLEKAKILLTRAAAKEKNLKEQLIIWKRKCSELQNVPVIDEISE